VHDEIECTCRQNFTFFIFNDTLFDNCSGTLGVGFYGNEEMKKGDNSMYTAASDAKDVVTDISTQVCFCEQFFIVIVC